MQEATCLVSLLVAGPPSGGVPPLKPCQKLPRRTLLLPDATLQAASITGQPGAVTRTLGAGPATDFTPKLSNYE